MHHKNGNIKFDGEFFLMIKNEKGYDKNNNLTYELINCKGIVKVLDYPKIYIKTFLYTIKN